MILLLRHDDELLQMPACILTDFAGIEIEVEYRRIYEGEFGAVTAGGGL